MENNHLLNDRLPYGNAKLILGIASIVLSPALVGFVLGVISVYLVDKDNKMLSAFPGNYSNDAVKNHKMGLIWSWAGFVISLVLTILIVYYFYTYGTINFDRIKEIKGSSK